MRHPRGAEEWLAAVNAIIESFREKLQNEYADVPFLTLAAIAALRELGVNEGDAMRWLKPHLRGI